MTQLAICTDIDRCVGCLACSVACKVVNGVPVGNFWNKTLRVGPTPKAGGSGQDPDVEMYVLNIQCQHCANPACVHVCPTEASYKAADGSWKGGMEICADKITVLKKREDGKVENTETGEAEAIDIQIEES